MERLDIILIILGTTLCAIGVYFSFVRKKTRTRKRKTQKAHLFKKSAVIPFSIGTIMLVIAFVSIQSQKNPSDISRKGSQQEVSTPENVNTDLEQGQTDSSDFEGSDKPIEADDDNVAIADKPLFNKLEQTNTLTITEESKLQVQSSNIFPSGSWIMIEYKENNTDLSYMTTGSASFTQVSPERQAWEMQIQSVDVWGNRSHYNYNGYMTSTNDGYEIQIETSNDPNFNRTPATDLILDMNDGLLKLEFQFKDNSVKMQFAQ